MTKEKVVIFIFTISLGILAALIPSIINKVSFKSIIIRCLIGALLMLLPAFFLSLFVGEEKQESKKNKFNKSSDFLSENTDNKNTIYTTDSDEDLSYNKILNTNSNGNLFKESDEKFNFQNQFIDENENQQFKNNNYYSEQSLESSTNEFEDSFEEDEEISDNDVLADLEKEVGEGVINIDPEKLKTTDYSISDEEISSEHIKEDDKQDITTFSSEAKLSGAVTNMDEDYIYFSNDKKIENDPEKLAKTIRRVLKEDED